MTRIWLVPALFCLLLALPASAAPTQPAAPKPTAAKPTIPSPAAAPAGKPAMTNGVTKAAANVGVRTCLPRIEQTSNFLTANTQSKAILFLPTADADKQITSASFEIQLSSKAVAYASMTAAPAPAGCDALYETVVYWTGSCAEVAKKGFPTAKPLGVVQQYIQVLQAGPNLKIFLMPAGDQGCVAIKKEVIF